MKKFVIIPLLLLGLGANAQYFANAAQYTEKFDFGNARSAGMAGAFGGLGCNTTAIASNPAGLALSESNNCDFTLDLGFDKTEGSYLGNVTTSKKPDFSISNFGISIYSETPSNNLLVRNVNFAFTINKTNDFNRNLNSFGSNANKTILKDEYLKDLITPDLLLEGLDLSKGMNQYQEFEKRSKGDAYDFDFAIAANFGNIIHLGGSLCISTTNYEEHFDFYEYDSFDSIPDFEAVEYKQFIEDEGVGISGKFGLLITPVPFIHFGGAVHTPTIVDVKRTSDYSLFNLTHYNANNFIIRDYNYTLISPTKLYGNLGVVFGNFGAFDIDVEHIDYSAAEFDNVDRYSELNSENAKELKAVTNIKAGAELNFGPYSLRGGVAMYDNPIANSNIEFGEYRTTYTLGLGMHADGFYLDFAYMHTSGKYDQLMYYDLNYNSICTNVDYTNNRVLMTLGLKF